MSTFASREFLGEVACGSVPGYKIVNKYGANPDVAASTLEDIWFNGGVYTWPQAASTLEVVSTSANDTAAGSGARSITIEGLDSNWDEASETVATNGTSASSATSTSFIRVNRAFVATTGTYCSTTTTSGGSNIGNITVRNSSAGQTHIIISDGSAYGTVGMGQSQVARYTVPDGFQALIVSYNITVDSNKTPDVFLFSRQNADDTSAPVDPKRLKMALYGIPAPISHRLLYMDSFAARTDMWWSAYGPTGGAGISVDFQILLCPP